MNSTLFDNVIVDIYYSERDPVQKIQVMRAEPEITGLYGHLQDMTQIPESETAGGKEKDRNSTHRLMVRVTSEQQDKLRSGAYVRVRYVLHPELKHFVPKSPSQQFLASSVSQVHHDSRLMSLGLNIKDTV